MSKRHICKNKFTIFLDIYENSTSKNLNNPSCPSHPKMIEIIDKKDPPSCPEYE